MAKYCEHLPKPLHSVNEMEIQNCNTSFDPNAFLFRKIVHFIGLINLNIVKLRSGDFI